MSNALSVVADFSKQLAASVSLAQTTAILNNALDGDGNQLTNQKTYGFTIDSGSKKEYFIAYLDNGNELSSIFSISRQGVASAGFAKAHAVGASVQITDWAALSYITKVLNGDLDLDSGTPLKYGDTPAQTNPLALATVQFVLDTASGSTVLAFNPQTIDGVAGEAVTDGDWVYFKEADGQWYKTDALAAGTSVNVKIGKVRASADAEAAITGGIFISGTETLGTYSAGQAYYLSDTAGELATSAGTNSVKVGVGDDNGDLVMTHIYPQEVTDGQKDALAGNGGTPSASNKFVTQEGLSNFGDGSDGDVTISTPTTLTRNMYYDNLTVNSTLTTDGYLIFVKGTLSGSGTIKAPDGASGGNGGNGGATTGGTAGTAGASSANGLFPTKAGLVGKVGHNAGADGGGTAPNGEAGNNGNAGRLGGTGGAGGSGGTRATPVSSSGGTATAKLKPGTIRDFDISGLDLETTGLILSSGGGSGGSGGGGESVLVGGGGDSGSGGGGGGSGAGGGAIFICAKTWAGTFTLRAVGGNGGNGGNNGTGYYHNGGGGGGAGGGGGSVLVRYGTKTWSGAYVLTAGTGGTGGSGNSSNNGTAGANGVAGNYYEFQN